MRKSHKRLVALVIVISMVTGLFIGCTESNENKVNNGLEYMLADMTKDEITLSYWFWYDMEINEKLKEEFEKLYPNITVKLIEHDVGSSGGELSAMAAAGKLPDCFLVLGSPEVFASNGLLFDMSLLWEYDTDSKNVIKGINEFKLGYLGTEGKWVTPAKFFPTAAFLNLDVFIRNDEELPSMDWTWDEFESTVERMTREDKVTGKHVFGTTSGVSVITWYPLASDKSCIGEFGWNGTEYDMENWVYGMELEKKWVTNENTPHLSINARIEDLEAKYGEGVYYPEEVGYSAIHCDHWWNWEDYYITDEYIEENNIVFVPYMMPHVKGVEDGNYLATMDMGGISAHTEYPREAYELLKFMTWGAEGWKHKLKYYPDLIDNEGTVNERPVAKNNCPITLDEDVWEGFAKWHPNSETGDKYIVEKLGEEYNRSKYFEYFLKQVKKSTWTCYGGQQIAGFDIWLQTVYYGYDGKQDFGYDGGLGIEEACIYGNSEAQNYYEYLQDEGNRIYKEKFEELTKEIAPDTDVLN